MSITHEEIVRQLATHRDNLLGVLRKVENDVVRGRDEGSVPIYLTKYRVKSADSLFLKTKRRPKAKSIQDITDLAGIRVICLFNQDIEPVFSFLLKSVFSDDRPVTECEIYGFSEHEATKLKNHEAWKDHLDAKSITPDEIKIDKKGSGYQSIHFLGKYNMGRQYTFELQLRTLLQDVWGELEHALNYKQQSANAYIKQTFDWFQGDLNNVGRMLSELKNVRDQDKISNDFMRKLIGPYKFLDYDDAFSDPFAPYPQLKKQVDQYTNFCMNERDNYNSHEFSAKARSMFDKIRAMDIKPGVPLTEYRNEHIDYWLSMEEAYCYFCEGEHEKALKIYRYVTSQGCWSDKYVPHFRMGEIYFLQQLRERALEAFDKADAILGDDSTCPITSLNKYRIKVKLAWNYWSIGRDFLPLSLSYINSAQQIANQIDSRLSQEDQAALANNLCWYNLEAFVSEFEKDPASSECVQSFKNAQAAYENLETFLNKEDVSSDALDTAAWFLFNRYKYSNNSDDLFASSKLCALMLSKRSRSTLKTAITLLQSDHMQKIAQEMKRISGPN